jgi:hypothetical protein
VKDLLQYTIRARAPNDLFLLPRYLQFKRLTVWPPGGPLILKETGILASRTK